jgi:hypothetical protein
MRVYNNLAVGTRRAGSFCSRKLSEPDFFGHEIFRAGNFRGSKFFARFFSGSDFFKPKFFGRKNYCAGNFPDPDFSTGS